MIVARRGRSAVALSGAVGLWTALFTALATAGTAGADPQDPPPPPPPPPASALAGIGSVLAQSGGAPVGPLGLPEMPAIGPTLLLAQYPIPTAPGAPAPVPGSLSAFDPDFLLPQNLTPAAPGAGEPAPGIGPDAESPGTGRIAFLRRLHEMYAAGQLEGALLGQRPPEPVAEVPTP